MIQLTKIGNSPNVPTKEYICDHLTDIKQLPNSPAGSTALCLEDKSVWVKGSDTTVGTNGWVLF